MNIEFCSYPFLSRKCHDNDNVYRFRLSRQDGFSHGLITSSWGWKEKGKRAYVCQIDLNNFGLTQTDMEKLPKEAQRGQESVFSFFKFWKDSTLKFSWYMPGWSVLGIVTVNVSLEWTDIAW